MSRVGRRGCSLLTAFDLSRSTKNLLFSNSILKIRCQYSSMIETSGSRTVLSSNFADEGFAKANPGAADIETNNCGRILVVDDEECIRTIFSQCLSEQYECATAGSANEALEY